MNITVYLSSKTNVSPSFTEAVVTLATGIGEMGAHLIYGGSNAGQMHILAETAKAAGATDGLPRGIYLIHYGTHTENILVE